MKTDTNPWVKSIYNGLIGGAITLLLGLIGMILAFAKVYIITGLFTMAQVFLLFPFIYEGYLSARNAAAKSWLATLLTGGLAGLMGGAVLAAVTLIGQGVNLRQVLINASPDLFALITFHLALVPGLVVLLIVSALAGMIGAAVLLLSSRIRGALVQAVMYVILIGLFRDLIVTVITHWGPIQYAFKWMFAPNGLSIPGAVVIFLLVGGLLFWRMGKAKIAAAPVRSTRQQKYLRWGTWGLIALFALLLPQILGSYFSEILDNVGIYILMGLGLNIVVGFAGLLDLGYVAFYAIGAYTLGILTTSESVGILHLSFWAATPIALVVAVFAGVVLGLPILRLRGDYLAIVTLGFGEIIRILVLSDWMKPLLGGSEGVQRIIQPEVGRFYFDNQQKLYYLILAGILLAGFVATRLKDSHLGRSWMALREDEDVAEAMGINKVATKLLAFGMGALFSGLGGALFATKIGSVYPQSFSFIVSINILSLIIIGGLGSIPGVFIGALALVGLPLLLSQFADFRYLIYGAVLVIMMLQRPEGLAPEARRRLELHEDESGPGASEQAQPASTDPGH
jgi:branched-chain amino acid transport system permease protein